MLPKPLEGKSLYLTLVAASVLLLNSCLLVAPAKLAQLSPSEFGERITGKDAFIVDVHIPEQEHLNGTDLFIPYNRIKQHIGDFPSDKNTPIYLYCKSGHMANVAARVLLENGYTRLYNLNGGTDAWKKADTSE